MPSQRDSTWEVVLLCRVLISATSARALELGPSAARKLTRTLHETQPMNCHTVDDARVTMVPISRANAVSDTLSEAIAPVWLTLPWTLHHHGT